MTPTTKCVVSQIQIPHKGVTSGVTSAKKGMKLLTQLPHKGVPSGKTSTTQCVSFSHYMSIEYFFIFFLELYEILKLTTPFASQRSNFRSNFSHEMP